MTDPESNADDELDAVRERKLEALKRKARGTADGPRDAGSGGDGTGDAGFGSDGATGDVPPGEPIHVEDREQYESSIARYPVVLVDFYADWCGPCKMLEPIVDDLAAESDAAVLKVDVDAHQGLARDLQVQGVPTLFVFADGEPVDRVVGVTEKHELEAKIDAAA